MLHVLDCLATSRKPPFRLLQAASSSCAHFRSSRLGLVAAPAVRRGGPPKAETLPGWHCSAAQQRNVDSECQAGYTSCLRLFRSPLEGLIWQSFQPPVVAWWESVCPPVPPAQAEDLSIRTSLLSSNVSMALYRSRVAFTTGPARLKSDKHILTSRMHRRPRKTLRFHKGLLH